MDAKKYIRKAALICTTFDHGNCTTSGCPLHDLKCGLPEESDDQDEAIRIVEAYKEPLSWYTCPHCSVKGHQEDAKFCRGCGQAIKGEMPDA